MRTGFPARGAADACRPSGCRCWCVWLIVVLLIPLVGAGCGDRAIRGRVVSGTSPVADAVVRVQGTSYRTLSDAEGRFELRHVPDGADVVLTAWQVGHFVGWATLAEGRGAADIRLRPYVADNVGYAWLPPGPDLQEPLACGNCHPQIYGEWQASGHAGSATNIRVLNEFEGTDARGRPNRGFGYRLDPPDVAEACGGCHAPAAASRMDEYVIDLSHLTARKKKQGVR